MNRFITFEGPEGSGKSTHSNLLCRYLRKKGYRVIHLREPGGTNISEQLRRILLAPDNSDMSESCELFLYLASRAQLVKNVIIHALKKGKFVVCDRFSDSTLAYQGYGAGLDLALVKRLCREASLGLEPAFTILLDIPAKDGLMRAGRVKDRLERKSIAYHTRVRQGYLRLAKENPGRIKVFASLGDAEEVQRELRLFVERNLL